MLTGPEYAVAICRKYSALVPASGFEDGIRMPDGSVARSNAEMVRAAADIAAIYGLQPASVEEARARFGI